MLPTAIMCSLRHDHRNLPLGFGIAAISGRIRMSKLWEGQLNGSESALLDGLSAEARRAGICPNHVYLLRSEMARIFVGQRY